MRKPKIKRIGNVRVTTRTANVIRKILAFQRDHNGLHLIGVEKVSQPEMCACCGHTRMTKVHVVEDNEGNVFRVGTTCNQALTEMDLREVLGDVA